jgi:predicted enzyme related to lactoylglutathione lyase
MRASTRKWAAHIPVSYWNFYFNVDAIGAAIQRVESGGGKVVVGPMQVPGGGWIITGEDPQGAMFSLVSSAE